MTEVSINKQGRLSEHLTSSSVAALGHSSELDGSRLLATFTKDSAKYVPIERIRAKMTIAKVNLARNLNSLKLC